MIYYVSDMIYGICVRLDFGSVAIDYECFSSNLVLMSSFMFTSRRVYYLGYVVSF